MTTSAVTFFLALLTLVALGGVLGTLVVVTAGGRRARNRLHEILGPSAVLIALAVAVISTLGSLYLSEVARFVPCTLCWYQRIAMYPLVPILIVLAGRREPAGRWYAVPLAAIGAPISAYHYVQQRFPALDSGACEVDVPCTVVWVERFGFITIPFMALAGFLLVLTSLLAWYRSDS